MVSFNDDTLNDKTNPTFQLRYVDIGNVDSSGRIKEIAEYIYKDAPSRARRIVKNGDIIVSTVRTYLKAITQIIDDTNLIVSTGFAVLRPKLDIHGKFLCSVVQSNYLINKIVSKSFGVSYPAINPSELAGFNICFPSLHEQQAIAAHIEIETANLDNIVSTIEKEIALVQEYRTALIAEAVTGKIDVRDYVIPQHNVTDEEDAEELTHGEAEYETLETDAQ